MGRRLIACWIHAVLRKIEGDAGNSRYWHARAAHSYGVYADTENELAASKRELASGRSMESVIGSALFLCRRACTRSPHG